MTEYRISYKDWNIEALTGYKPITTFYMDFSIADRFGRKAIKDTYKNAVRNAKTLGYKYLTELVMALNWKVFEHYDKMWWYADLYRQLWEQLHAYALETLKGDELTYYLETTD